MSEIAKGWSITVTYDKEYRLNTFAPVNVPRYHATLVGDTPPACLKEYGQMTKDEAIAMMRLLNASQTY